MLPWLLYILTRRLLTLVALAFRSDPSKDLEIVVLRHELGAQAAWMGTRFIVAEESTAHPEYKDRVTVAHETDAVLSTCIRPTGRRPGRGWRAQPASQIQDSLRLRNHDGQLVEWHRVCCGQTGR